MTHQISERNKRNKEVKLQSLIAEGKRYGIELVEDRRV